MSGRQRKTQMPGKTELSAMKFVRVAWRIIYVYSHPMRDIIASIEGEFRRYKVLADQAIDQLADHELSMLGPGEGNSIVIIAWHLSGNLKSRFTDFLTSDGEKPWRNRDEEFESRKVTRSELKDKWNGG